MTINEPAPGELGVPAVPAGEAYDELWTSPGQARPAHALLSQYIQGRSPDELQRLRNLIRRRLVEQEVTYNILGTPDGTNRPWDLDPLPHILDHTEFERLAQGLRQRADLLNLIIEDIYGPQRLVKERVLPPALVFGHPEFWRACHGFEPKGRRYLYLYAADVGRRPTGEFCVFSDRTGAPTGSGYALENRLVLGGTLADLFRQYSVLKLNVFFQNLRRILESLSAQDQTEPRIVLLTPGLQDQSSFEHAYLARYLGFELVEGRDLIVRDNTVYLKTLAGLSRVDVILRRVFDGYCDPLKLRQDSVLGVAGLVAAARNGGVAIANVLGSQIVESAVFKAYLPRICQFLLGEDLLLPSVVTRWCGDTPSLEQVSAKLDDWIIKPAFFERAELLSPAHMSLREKTELFDKVRSRPSDFVAEKWETLSVAPLWQDNRLQSYPLSLRFFLSWAGESYEVMPGGLARVRATPDGLFLTQGGDTSSKDVWVPSPAPEPRLALPRMPERPVELRRGGVDLPSRLLDDVYWLGRYVERGDNTARLARAGLERIGLEAGQDASDAVLGILNALLKLEVTSDLGTQLTDDRAFGPGQLLLQVVYDRSQPNNLMATLDRVHALTVRVRSRLSKDAWFMLRRLSGYRDAQPDVPESMQLDLALDFLHELLITLSAVNGTILDNMVHGPVWSFLDMGRRVERGVFLLVLSQALLPERTTRVHLEALLEIMDSLLTYRARYLSALQAAPVVDLLLTDDTNPQSLLYQANVLVNQVSGLPPLRPPIRRRVERPIITLQSSLKTLDVEAACAGDGQALRAFLNESSSLLFQFSDDLSHAYFSHAQVSRAVAPPAWIDEELEAR